MTYPLVAELADAGIPVTVSCRVLKLARQPYYRWRNAPVRDADVARSAEGWRPYNGGGMHDPASITGGHYDHLHFTAIP